MKSLFGRKKALAAELERLMETDLDAAAERLFSHRGRLRRVDASRLEATVRRRMEAREHRNYLSKVLAEGAISATAACELLEAYEDAGYVTARQFDMLRRHAFEAHRREVLALLADPNSTRFDYFRTIDGYRAAGYLGEQELQALGHLLDVKLNPGIAARRLFAEAKTTLDLDSQEELLQRYLVEFEGFGDYPEVASLYVSLKIHQLWEMLPGVRFAREATRAVHELNNPLTAYLPHTSDLSNTVPIERIVSDFYALAGEFKPQPDPDRPIAERHLNQRVVVVEKIAGAPGSYESERNEFVSVGAEGRVRAVRGSKVIVSHKGSGFPYSRSWAQSEFAATKHARLQRLSTLAVWDQSEIGLVQNRKPSPVFVHQFREAVRTMSKLLEKHREDNPPAEEGPKLLEARSEKMF